MGLKIQSKEIIDKISEELKLQPALEIPRELMDKIQLVYGINPEPKIQILSGSANDSATATIHTTSDVKDTFLVGITLTVAKSVLSTSIESAINCTTEEGDLERAILRLRYEPVTAGQFSESMTFPFPIKLKRGTTITVTNTTSIASIDASGSIQFFEKDPQ